MQYNLNTIKFPEVTQALKCYLCTSFTSGCGETGFNSSSAVIQSSTNYYGYGYDCSACAVSLATYVYFLKYLY